jgi:hypothetical protein
MNRGGCESDPYGRPLYCAQKRAKGFVPSDSQNILDPSYSRFVEIGAACLVLALIRVRLPVGSRAALNLVGYIYVSYKISVLQFSPRSSISVPSQTAKRYNSYSLVSSRN